LVMVIVMPKILCTTWCCNNDISGIKNIKVCALCEGEKREKKKEKRKEKMNINVCLGGESVCGRGEKGEKNKKERVS